MFLALLGCAGPDLSFSPASLDLGEVDFTGEMPDDGYATASVDLTNVTGPTFVLSLPEYDTDRLCLQGFPVDGDYPVDLGELAEGSTYTFGVGVCWYLPGEEDTEVSTQLVVKTDGNPSSVTLPITFTPIRTK
jgi:hypothetical protein